MGGAAKTVTRGLTAGVTGGLSEFARKDPFGSQIGRLNPVYNIGRNFLPNQLTGDENPDTSLYGGNFSISPEELAANRGAITGLGQKQFDSTNQFITQDAASRTSARDALAQQLMRQSNDSFQFGLPQTYEDLNARHLLNGSGVGQEIARQQAQMSRDIANQVGVQGAQDINTQSAQRQSALQGFQGLEQQGLSRQFSLEDFIRQANVAKQIGAASAPQASNGKGNAGTLMSGIGAMAPMMTAVRGFGKGGPVGAAAALAPTLAASAGDRA